MPVKKLNVQVPEDIADLLGVGEEVISREISKLTVFELFREGKISSGKGAELLGISRFTFMEFLAEKNIPFFDYSKEELQQEFRAAEEIRSRLAEESP